jgi:hypothetical protein
MASYAISSSFILVIHDNMIIGTNHIVWHVFVGISRSQGCKKNTCQKERIKGQNRAREGKEKTPSDEPTVPQIQASMQSSDELVYRVKP